VLVVGAVVDRDRGDAVTELADGLLRFLPVLQLGAAVADRTPVAEGLVEHDPHGVDEGHGSNGTTAS